MIAQTSPAAPDGVLQTSPKRRQNSLQSDRQGLLSECVAKRSCTVGVRGWDLVRGTFSRVFVSCHLLGHLLSCHHLCGLCVTFHVSLHHAITHCRLFLRYVMSILSCLVLSSVFFFVLYMCVL